MNVTSISVADTAIALFGILPLSTHRDHLVLGPDATTYFQYETFIAAISIFFFRVTVRHEKEHRAMSYFFGVLLGCLAYWKKSYDLITAVELFSYAASWLLLQTPAWLQRQHILLRLLAIAASAAASLFLSHYILLLLTPIPGNASDDNGLFLNLVNRWFPIVEIQAAYRIMITFAHPEVLSKQLSHLFFVTFHIQAAMGFLGIDFLRQEQSRRNQLIRLDVTDPSASSALSESDGGVVHADNGERHTHGSNHQQDGSKEGGRESSSILAAKHARARRFQRGAAPFILFCATPYMLQIITYGNINKFAFTCLEHDLHRTVRLNELFDDDSNLAAMAQAESAAPPDGTWLMYK